jgi:hypothetical protein
VEDQLNRFHEQPKLLKVEVSSDVGLIGWVIPIASQQPQQLTAIPAGSPTTISFIIHTNTLSLYATSLLQLLDPED